MRRPFLGAFLGSLLQPLITRTTRKLAGPLLLAVLVAVVLVVRWLAEHPGWALLGVVLGVVWLLAAPADDVPVRPVPLDEQPHFLYRWFSPDGDLLYIGISNDLARRTGQHIADKPWMTPGVRCEAESYPNRAAVLAAEEQAIYRENPRWNVVHNRGPLW